MIDSWTKFQAGVSYGNRIDFGNYDQCLDFEYSSNDVNIGLIQGQHCLIYYQATPNASESPSPAESHQSDLIGFDWSEMWVKQCDVQVGVCDLIKLVPHSAEVRLWGNNSCVSVVEFACRQHVHPRRSNHSSMTFSHQLTYKWQMIMISRNGA